MAANMDRGVLHYLSAGGRPWWSMKDFGVDEITESMLINDTSFNFPVENVPVYLKSGKMSNMTSVTMRMDEMIELGAATPTYEPIQQAEMITFAFSIADACDLKVATAGITGDGERTWIMLQLREPLVIGKSDNSIQFITIMLGRDGSVGFMAAGGMIRIVCENTFMAYLTAAKKLKNIIFHLKQTKNVRDRMTEAKQKVVLMIRRLQRMAEQARALAATPVTEKAASSIITKVVDNFIMPGGTPSLDDVLEFSGSVEIQAKYRMEALFDTVLSETERRQREKREEKRKDLLDTIIETYEYERLRNGKHHDNPDNAYLLVNGITDVIERKTNYRGDDHTVMGSMMMDQVLGKSAIMKSNVMQYVTEATIQDKALVDSFAWREAA